MKTRELDTKGRSYWRSLEEREASPEYFDRVKDEFPEMPAELLTSVTRRSFLSLMGASFALAGLTGCIRRPEENILPYTKAPEEIIPGLPNYYASAYSLGGVGLGVLVESHEGRPTKVEGNPGHPLSRGATDAYAQVSVLELYDPDRATAYKVDGKAADQKAVWDKLIGLQGGLKGAQGQGLRILSEASTSPSLEGLRKRLASLYPSAVWHTYEPLNDSAQKEGVKLAFGQALQPQLSLEAAKVIFSLDADFLLTETGSVLHTRQFADGRRVDGTGSSMGRLYVAESVFSLTGTMADHRLRVASSQLEALLRAVGAELVKRQLPLAPELVAALQPFASHGFDPKWVAGLAADLMAHQGAGVIVVGRRQPATVHALAHALNFAMGNVGQTIRYTQALDAAFPETTETSLEALVTALKAGQVSTLLILGGNPVYNAPVDVDFGTLLKGVANSLHLSIYENETSSLCKLFVPRASYLEAWGDVRTLDGTASIVQPLVEPLFNGATELELLQVLIEGAPAKGYDLVRRYWQENMPAADFEKAWRRALHEGVVAGSAFAPVVPVPAMAGLGSALQAAKVNQTAPTKDSLEVVFVQDSKVYDGRYANLGWMQELPDPITKLTWDNAALMSLATSKALGVKNKDLVTVGYQGKSLTLPVWVVQGMADFSVAIALGYGRTSVGRVSTGAGFNAYSLRQSKAPYFDVGVTVKPAGGTYALATTQEHGRMEGRPLIREGTLEEYRKDPQFVKEMLHHPPLTNVYTEHELPGQQWGMAIDLNTCTGCNACVVACQAENNIPVVGKKQVLAGREMAWIRLDRYFVGEDDNPEIVQQPMACQHCENAPCEPVCPVAATVHAKQGGTNDMVYNRCIGTRYCSNNCPYKVRRFNFFNYHENFTEVERMQQNPDVTVRMRGVMEKCSYCIQRVNAARRVMKLTDQAKIPDGGVTPACAQVCPAQAIVFGDVRDPESRVSKLKARELNYDVLAEFNTRPRTSYLARLRNPNPEIG